MHFSETLDNGQSEDGSVGLGCEEGVQETFSRRRVYAHTALLHGDLDKTIPFGSSYAQRALIRHGLIGVGDEVWWHPAPRQRCFAIAGKRCPRQGEREQTADLAIHEKKSSVHSGSATPGPTGCSDRSIQLVGCMYPNVGLTRPNVCGKPLQSWPSRGPLVHLPSPPATSRSEEHTSELQSRQYLVCRL